MATATKTDSDQKRKPKTRQWRVVLISSENCVPCDELKQRYKEHLERGYIETLEIAEDEEALDLVMSEDISSFPQLLLLGPDGKVFARLYEEENLVIEERKKEDQSV